METDRNIRSFIPIRDISNEVKLRNRDFPIHPDFEIARFLAIHAQLCACRSDSQLLVSRRKFSVRKKNRVSLSLCLSLSLFLVITNLRFAFLEIIDNYAAVSRREKKKKERKKERKKEQNCDPKNKTYIYIYCFFHGGILQIIYSFDCVPRVVSFLDTSVTSVTRTFTSNFIVNRVVIVVRFHSRSSFDRIFLAWQLYLKISSPNKNEATNEKLLRSSWNDFWCFISKLLVRRDELT